MVPRADVYLFPAVVGGGLGDIEEVLAAGRELARARHRVHLFRAPGRALPRGVDGPWDWPPMERTHSLTPRAASAVTLAPAWGISAAPDQRGPLGRGGPWQVEAALVEEWYGTDRTLHVSLEEFARTWTARREATERWREGGRPLRELRARAGRPEFEAEVVAWRRAYRRFRAFDRPNVAHLYATFRPNPAFAREFPEAIQCGPLWSRLHRGVARRSRRRPGRPTWAWYASPASAERLLPAVLAGLDRVRPVPFLWVRTSRPWARTVPADRGRIVSEPLRAADWRRRFDGAELRIVTGSRTLLEAIEVGGPFLYFNGLVGSGRSRRRHRPDKLEALILAGPRAGASSALLRDLRDVGLGRRVEG